MKATIPRLTWVMGGNDRGKCEVSCPRRVGNQAWFGHHGDDRNAYPMNSLRWLRPENSGELEGRNVAYQTLPNEGKRARGCYSRYPRYCYKAPLSHSWGNDMYLSHQPIEWDRVSCPFCRERGTTEQEKLARMMKKCPYMASWQKTLFFVHKLNRP